MTPKQFISDLGGVASTVEVAEFLDISRSSVQEWAAQNSVGRLGPAFAFDVKSVELLASELEEDELDDQEDEDEEDEDEDFDDEDEGDLGDDDEDDDY